MLKHQRARALAFLLLWAIFHPAAFAQVVSPNNTTVDSILPPVQATESIQEQITSVNQLADVQPTDWAFQALQSLVERYSCISGYPNRTFRGNQAVSRYEFAAGLSACLDRINELLAATSNNLMRQDLETLRRLQAAFTTELATLRSRVDSLEVQTATLESQHFSTTTKLRGFVIMAANAGGFGGDLISLTSVATKSPVPNPMPRYFIVPVCFSIPALTAQICCEY
jgi:porin